MIKSINISVAERQEFLISRRRSTELTRRVAIHEVGHLIPALCLGAAVDLVSTRRCGTVEGLALVNLNDLIKAGGSFGYLVMVVGGPAIEAMFYREETELRGTDKTLANLLLDAVHRDVRKQMLDDAIVMAEKCVFQNTDLFNDCLQELLRCDWIGNWDIDRLASSYQIENPIPSKYSTESKYPFINERTKKQFIHDATT